MLGTDAVMDAIDPSFQISEDQVDYGQEFLCDLRVSAFGDRVMVESAFAKPGIAAPVVGDDQRFRSNDVLNETAERIGSAVGDDGETNASRVAPVFPIVEDGFRLDMQRTLSQCRLRWQQTPDQRLA